MPPRPLPDPETLLIIGAIGAVLGAAFAIANHVAFTYAIFTGQRLESPEVIEQARLQAEGRLSALTPAGGRMI